MTASRDPDRLLAAYLADGMNVLPDRVVDAVLDEVHRTHQRAVFGPRRTPLMNSMLKMAFAAAAVVAVVVAGINFLPAGNGGLGGPGSSPSPVVSPSPVTSPSLTPIPSPKAARITVAGTDPAGATDPVRLTATLPGTWEAGDYAANSGSVDPGGAAFFASTITATFSDPCAHIPRSPNVGPTVAEAATALTEIPDISATDPVQAQLAGHDATLVELSIPASLPCAPEQFLLWTDDPSVDGGWWALAANESIRVYILEVRGRPVAIATRTFPGTTDATKAELQASIDSIVFDVPAAGPSATAAAS
jgi:hypothetical protein